MKQSEEIKKLEERIAMLEYTITLLRERIKALETDNENVLETLRLKRKDD